MAFNAAQQDAFFTNGPQMGLPPTVRARMAAEGLILVSDLQDFKEDQLETAIKNLKTSIPGIPAQVDPAGVVIMPAIPPIPPVIVPARCVQRLKVAAIAYHYYIDTDRTPTPANMNYTNVLREFYEEWEAIITLTKQDKPSVPVLAKPMTPVKWMESFKDCLFRTFGVRKCPLSYVIREDDAVAPEATAPLLPNKAYSEVAGSVLSEMIQRFSHTHSLFKQDNSMVYSLLDEATRGTIYAPTIKPFARTKNGREAYLAIMTSHAGNDKWEQLQKDKMSFLMNTKWNGRTYSLEKFTGLHRSAYVTLEEAATYVQFQLPNERSRVGFLIDNIQCSDADLKARIANIEANTNNMRDDFEATVTYLLPADPYAKQRGRQNNTRAEISDVSLKGKGFGTSKTGVDFRWYTPTEYSQLTAEQKQELYQWQRTKEGQAAIKRSKEDKEKGGKGNKKNKKLKAKIASLQKDLDEQKNMDIDTIKALISDVTKVDHSKDDNESKKRAVSDNADPYSVAAVALQQIIKRNKK